MRLTFLAGLAIAPFAFGQASFQISSLSISMSVSTTATQAVLQYSSPTEEACSVRAADMNRRITISAATQSQGTVTVTTKGAHGLLPGSVIYIEGSGIEGWNGWQVAGAVAGPNSFKFASDTAGSSATGNIGVLVDDVNPGLFPAANLDSRSGNPNSGRRRVFVLGRKSADIASDGNRYTRALQVNSRHRFRVTCGSQDYDQEFTTQNLPLGDTHNEAPPVDRSNPGQYAYPTVQWANRAQSLIDPATGVRSVRGTGPAGTVSTAKNFQTAIDSSGQWGTPTGPLSPGGTAAFTGPCQSGDCALFLRADDLTLPGGATYKTGYGEGSSLDWATVTISGAWVNSAECTADSQQPNSDACRIAACLTVNGVTCSTAEREATLTNSPATYTLGSRTAMDLWQNSGAPAIARPNVSKSSGTANYSDISKRLTWASGDKFSIKWTPGSRILVAGSEYRIESVQSELSLTLAAPGPAGNLQQAPYSANNFGVLIRKKTTNGAEKVTVGYTTYQYGSSPMPVWPSMSVPNCSETLVTAGNLDGYNCFIGQELYWISKDGSDVRDLGLVRMSARYGEDKNLLWSTSATCGRGGLYSQFDPLDADTWYCLVLYKPWTDVQTQAILKAHYEGDHSDRTPAGTALPDCDLNNGARPCVRFTPMQPRYEDGVTTAGYAFNPEFAASGYVTGSLAWGGISKEGDILIMTREAGGQDTKGWQFVFTLGDRTPAGTGPNSLRPIAAASSYRHAPLTWCSMHTTSTPEDGWARFANNDFSYPRGPNSVYGMILTSALLTNVKGGAGGLDYCPENPLGASGQKCTEITVSSEPRLGSDGSYLQETQVGDLIRIDSEYLRIVKKTDYAHLTVERGYLSTAAAHAGSNLAMACGIRNSIGVHEAAWNYRADPYGRNADWSTVRIDHANVGGHLGEGGGVRVNSTGNWYRIGEALCPSALLTKHGICYQVRRGSLAEAMTQPTLGVAVDPPFGGAIGFGNPNQVDSHPGPCRNQWCLDGRPMNGGSSDGATTTAGSASSPAVNVGGQLWKFAGAADRLKRKTLATMAYAGRFPLLDVSGPGSRLPSDATGAYRYCVALKTGECAAGSSAGDVFVNAPFVSKPYCDYPGIAVQGDDTNSLCIGPLGAYTGAMVQFGTTRNDATGATIRRLGSLFARWNQQGVFWNASTTTAGGLLFSQVRWLDGLRHEDIITVLPPYPASDSIARNTFIPIEVKIPPQGGAATRAIVEFGYGENGESDQFYCTSRQEACVAATPRINQGTPFYFAQSETYSGVACASGCTITVPALSQRVLYYRWKQRNALGQVTAVSETRAVVTP